MGLMSVELIAGGRFAVINTREKRLKLNVADGCDVVFLYVEYCIYLAHAYLR